MEASKEQLCTLPQPCSRDLVSPRKELVPMSGALVFVAMAQGIPPDHLDVMSSRADLPQDCSKEFPASYTAGLSRGRASKPKFHLSGNGS